MDDSLKNWTWETCFYNLNKSKAGYDCIDENIFFTNNKLLNYYNLVLVFSSGYSLWVEFLQNNLY